MRCARASAAGGHILMIYSSAARKTCPRAPTPVTNSSVVKSALLLTLNETRQHVPAHTCARTTTSPLSRHSRCTQDCGAFEGALQTLLRYLYTVTPHAHSLGSGSPKHTPLSGRLQTARAGAGRASPHRRRYHTLVATAIRPSPQIATAYAWCCGRASAHSHTR